jgi:DNA-binding MarR family transcriptional regulator
MTRNARGTRDQAASRLHSLAIQLLRRVRKTDAATGLSPARASAMSVLVFGGPRTIGELAAVEMVSAPTMTRLVAGLEADGYLVRSADPEDARVWRVRATAKGKRVLEEGRRRRVAQVSELLSRLDSSAIGQVERALDVLEPLVKA